MLIFIIPTLIVAGLLWAGWLLYDVWRIIPSANAAFELGGGSAGRAKARVMCAPK